jgi:hypothetical protein
MRQNTLARSWPKSRLPISSCRGLQCGSKDIALLTSKMLHYLQITACYVSVKKM